MTTDFLRFAQSGLSTPAPQVISVFAEGGGSFAFTAVAATSGAPSWLSVSPASGTGPANLTISVNTTGVAAGVHPGQITITAPTTSGSPKVVRVELQVMSDRTGVLVVRPDKLEFEARAGGPAPNPKQIAISNPATASFAWTATAAVLTPAGGNWLKVHPASGSGGGVVDVSVDPAGLARGKYRGTVSVFSGALSAATEVEFEIEEADDDDDDGGPGHDSRVKLDPRVIHFEFEQNGGRPPRSRELELHFRRNEAMAWTATAMVSSPSGGAWLSVTPASGRGRAKLTALATPNGLGPGMYMGKIKVSAGAAGEDETLVFLRVRGPERPKVSVRPRALRFDFSLATGVAIPAAREVRVRSEASLAFTAAASTSSGGNWLSVSPASGTTPATLSVTVAPAVAATLSAGWYTGRIEIKTPGASQEVHNVHVTLRVLAASIPPSLAIEPAGLAFRATAGGANPASQNLTLRARGAASIAWTGAVSTAVGGNWLSATPLSGTVHAGTDSTVAVSVNTSGLATGIYGGAVVFTPAAGSGASLVTVLVRLVVAAESASLETAMVDVTAAVRPVVSIITDPGDGHTAHVGLPVNVSVAVLDAGGVSVEGARVLVRSSGPEPALTLEDDGEGRFSGLFVPLSGGVRTLTAEVEGQTELRAFTTIIVESTRLTPAVFVGGVVNAATFAQAPAPVAAGSLASVFGLGIASRSGAAARLPLPDRLGDVSVTIGGHLAPLLVVRSGSSEQINLQIPFELAGQASADVVVNNGGLFSPPETIQLGTSPGLFTVSQTGVGAGAFLHADFTPVNAARPAAPGQAILLFGTGCGAVSPPVATGAAASATSMSRIQGPVAATIGGRAAAVVFAGLAPGFAGLCQINVIVPPDVAAGEQEVSITVDGIAATGRAMVNISR